MLSRPLNVGDARVRTPRETLQSPPRHFVVIRDLWRQRVSVDFADNVPLPSQIRRGDISREVLRGIARYAQETVYVGVRAVNPESLLSVRGGLLAYQSVVVLVRLVVQLLQCGRLRGCAPVGFAQRATTCEHVLSRRVLRSAGPTRSVGRSLSRGQENTAMVDAQRKGADVRVLQLHGYELSLQPNPLRGADHSGRVARLVA